MKVCEDFEMSVVQYGGSEWFFCFNVMNVQGKLVKYVYVIF